MAIKRDLFRARILLKNPINFAFHGAIKSTSIGKRISVRAYREPIRVRGEDGLTHPIARRSFIAGYFVVLPPGGLCRVRNRSSLNPYAK